MTEGGSGCVGSRSVKMSVFRVGERSDFGKTPDLCPGDAHRSLSIPVRFGSENEVCKGGSEETTVSPRLPTP